ncbi:MAG: DUF2852 domain-containing protein [Hyphomicrobium sp.]|nr:DUF2852 domain-containing protein [Hyphomicrobium sp.]
MAQSVSQSVGRVRRTAGSAGQWLSAKFRGVREAAPRASNRSDCQPGADRSVTATTGHSAFDCYRADVLRQLDEDAQAFSEFLDQLRFARDRAEFDAFLAERKKGSA